MTENIGNMKFGNSGTFYSKGYRRAAGSRIREDTADFQYISRKYRSHNCRLGKLKPECTIIIGSVMERKLENFFARFGNFDNIRNILFAETDKPISVRKQLDITAGTAERHIAILPDGA